MPILCRDAGNRDRVEIEEMVAGRWKAGRCRSGSVDEAVARLTEMGMPARVIGERLGIATRSVVRRRSGLRERTAA